MKVFRQVKLDRFGGPANEMYSIGPACASIEIARSAAGLSGLGNAEYGKAIISYDTEDPGDPYQKSVIMELIPAPKKEDTHA